MSERPHGVMAVLVVHERSLADVQAWSTLRTWLQSQVVTEDARLRQLLIYDNSSVPRAVPEPGMTGCRYINDPDNGGTAAAYSCAVSIASEQAIEWLLLLDHDTQLPTAFLEEAATRMGSVGEPTPAALVPWVLHGGRSIVSPARVTRSGSFRPLRPGIQPHNEQHISAIASGSVLHVATLRELLPIPQGLWLDYVDHWIFAQLHHRGSRIVFLEQSLQHDLSVAAPRTLTAARLICVLRGEAIYNRQLGRCAHFVYPWRLLWRVLRLTVTRPTLAVHALKWIVSGGLRGA